ncbi:MAG: hypothetical protein FJ189_02395 [Gammaproteobacteria bacterium]|nr:hypothetical protein [Gammaproteobacteria bacterium]
MWLALAAVILLAGTASADSPQSIQIVNENAAVHEDSDIYVLFVGNPAKVVSDASAGGTIIQGVRDLSLPVGTVSEAAVAGATTIAASGYPTNMNIPTGAYPLQFISGANAGEVVTVTGFSGGTFTLDASTPVKDAQTAGDQFYIGAYSQKLSDFPTGTAFTSPLSGALVTPRLLNAEQLDAGVLYLSYAPLTYISAAPGFDGTVGFQTVELTVGEQTNADLTAIDAYLMPLQLEMLTPGTFELVDRRTFYFNQPRILSDMTHDLGLTAEANGMILGPSQKPMAFPSYEHYLTSLIGHDFTITNQPGGQGYGAMTPAVVYGINVNANYTGTYHLSTSVASDAKGGYLVTMNAQGKDGNRNPNFVDYDLDPRGYFPLASDVSSITVALPADSFDTNIYGAVLDANSFQINTKTPQSLTPTTFSGPFPVTTATSAAVFTSSTLKGLDTAAVGGSGYVQFESSSRAYSATPVPISSISPTGEVTLASALPAPPDNGDTFQVLFQVQGQVNRTGNDVTFLAPALNNLGFLAPFEVTFKTGTFKGTTGTANAFSSSLVTFEASSGPASPAKPSSGDFYTVQVPESDAFTQLYANSIFSHPVQDFLAGINNGYVGSPVAGTDSAEWYYGFPQRFPFGRAQPGKSVTSGFYNPWAALFYNASDSYAFAFSDLVPPSPLLVNDSGNHYTLRITILPETQLNAPLVTATTETAGPTSTIHLSWEADSGVTYSLSSEPPIIAPANVSIDSAAGTATITKLPPGVPYRISVVGTKGAQQSYVLPVYITSAGSATPASGDLTLQFGFSWAGTGNLDTGAIDLYVNATLMPLSGTPPTYQVPPIFPASAPSGDNLFVVNFQKKGTTDPADSLYAGVIAVNFVDHGNDFSISGTPALYGSTNAVNPPSGGLTVAPPLPGPYAKSTNQLNLGMSFNPEVRKEFAPLGAGPTPPMPPKPTPRPPPAPKPTVTSASTPIYQPVVNQAQRDLWTLNNFIKKTKRADTGPERDQTIQQLKFCEKVARAVIANPSNNAMAELLNRSMKATKIKDRQRREAKFKKLRKRFRKIRWS